MVSNPMRDPAVTVGIEGDASSLDRAVDNAVASLGRLRRAAGLAGAGLAALGGGAMLGATKAAADFEQAMVEVEKVTNPQVAREMATEIRRMAETIPLAQNELATIAADAGRFGIEGPENISKFTESVAKMAEATDLSADQAGEALARISTLTDTPISQIENLGSSVNELSNNFATSSQEIVDSMLRSSAALSQLGLNQREIVGMSAALNEVSESSERAGTRLRRLGQEMMNPKNVGDLAAALGMTAQEFRQMREDSPSQVIRQMAEAFQEGGESADQLRTVLSTASRQAVAGLAQNMEGLTQGLDMANSSFEKATSLQREFDAATDTFNAKLALLRNRIVNVAIQLGNELLPILTPVVERVAEAIETFGQFNQQLDGMPAIAVAAGAAIGGLTLAVTAFGGAVAGAVVAAAPLIAILGAVTAAGAALAVAWMENWGGIRDITADVIDVVVDVLEDLMDVGRNVFQNITGFIEDNRRSFQRVFASIESYISGVADFLQTVLIPAVRWAFRTFEQSIQPVINSLRRNFGPVIDEVGQTINSLVGYTTIAGNAMLSWWSKIDGVVVPIVTGLANAIGDTLGFAIDQLAQGIQLVMNLVQGDFGASLENLKNIIGNTLDAAFDILGLLKDGFSAAAKWLVAEGPGAFIDGMNSLLDILFDVVFFVGDALADLGKKGVSWLMDKAGGFFDSLVDFIKRAVIAGITLGMSEGEQAGMSVKEARRQRFGSGTMGPAMATGGLVKRAGIATLHAGERVVPAAQVTDRGQVEASGGSVDVEVKFSGPGELVDLVREEAEIVVQRSEKRHADRARRQGVD